METRTADIGGPVRYDDYGGQGSPIVLVHGIGGARINWSLMAPRLAQHHRVWALDLVGFGETPLAGRRADVDSNQRLLQAFIEGVVGQPAVVAGHSMGGMIAMMEAARNREWTLGAVLIDPVFPPLRRTGAGGIPHGLLRVLAMVPQVGGRLGLLTTRRQGAEAVVVATFRENSAAFDAIDNGFIRAHVDAEALRMKHRDAYVGYLQAWRSMEWWTNKNLAALERDVVEAVRVPTLLIHGELDPLVLVAAARRLVELRPEWITHILPDIGHNPLFEDPARCVRLIEEWLSAVASEAPVA